MRAVVAEITRVQVVRFGAAPCWAPALNVYRYPDRFVVCAELAGISEQAISVQAEPRRLRLAGCRPPPEPRVEGQGPVEVFTMEIDHGRFERELSLPERDRSEPRVRREARRLALDSTASSGMRHESASCQSQLNAAPLRKRVQPCRLPWL